MQVPWVLFGSDGTAVRPDGLLGQGKPHPRWHGTFPRILGKYVHQEKVLPLEEAGGRSRLSLPIDRMQPLRGSWTRVKAESFKGTAQELCVREGNGVSLAIQRSWQFRYGWHEVFLLPAETL